MRGPRSLRARLVVANLIVVGVALGTVLVAVSLVGPGYFAEAMGHPPDDPAGQEMDAATLAAFGEAVRTALIAALVVAIAVAIAVALAVSTRIAGPITRLAAGARRIAGGHYAERVPTAGEGEVADLAASFNAMTSSLEATEQRRLRLVGDVAHELRTPLATLDGYLEGLEDGVVAPHPETWRLLRRETARLNRMVGDLQDLWRAEAGDLPLRMEPVDVLAVARDAVERAKTAPGTPAGSPQPDLLLDSPEGLLALVDRDRLAQVLDNYLSNALRYAPEGSPVEVRVAGRPGEIIVAVSDRGPGLTPEQRASVFERFYRIDPSRSRALGGAGIGLAIVRALAEAMRGRVWAESDGPGRGSTFFVAVPRV